MADTGRYFVYKFGKRDLSDVHARIAELRTTYGPGFAYETDLGGARKSRAQILKEAKAQIAKSSEVVVDLRYGVGRMMLEEAKHAESLGIKTRYVGAADEFATYAKAMAKGQTITWFDLETTGTNIFRGAIPTEIATMTLHPGGKVTHWSTILQTGDVPVSAEGWKTAAKYGGITQAKMAAGMPIREAAEQFAKVIGTGIVAGQNITEFDVLFGLQLFARAGIEPPEALVKASKQFDLLVAMRSKYGDRYESYAMSALEKRMNIRNPMPHYALPDTWAEMVAAHREMGLPEPDFPEEAFQRLDDPATKSTAAATVKKVVQKKRDDALKPFITPTEKQVLKHTGAEIGAELKGFGKTLLGAARKHPYIAAGIAALGGAWLVQQMRESRRPHTYNMQVTPAQMSRAYHANRVYV